MAWTATPVASNRFREPFGRYCADFEVGPVHEHRPRRALTQQHSVERLYRDAPLTRISDGTDERGIGASRTRHQRGAGGAARRPAGAS